MRLVGTHSSSDTTARCDCHEWHPVAAIGDWMVRRGGNDLIPARTWAQTGGIWRPGHCELTHEDLADRIHAAGGIACDYAIKARMLLSGEIELVNGLHRWVVAEELAIETMPVEMSLETEYSWSWAPELIS
jgi:hypothetical protein